MNIGPDTQRYGAFARILPAGESMRLVLDEAFARSLAGKPCTINLIYYDKQGDAIELSGGGGRATFTVKGEDSWKTATLSIDAANFTLQNDAHITLKAAGQDLILHLVEVQRDKKAQ